MNLPRCTRCSARGHDTSECQVELYPDLEKACDCGKPGYRRDGIVWIGCDCPVVICDACDGSDETDRERHKAKHHPEPDYEDRPHPASGRLLGASRIMVNHESAHFKGTVVLEKNGVDSYTPREESLGENMARCWDRHEDNVPDPGASPIPVNPESSHAAVVPAPPREEPVCNTSYGCTLPSGHGGWCITARTATAECPCPDVNCAHDRKPAPPPEDPATAEASDTLGDVPKIAPKTSLSCCTCSSDEPGHYDSRCPLFEGPQPKREPVCACLKCDQCVGKRNEEMQLRLQRFIDGRENPYARLVFPSRPPTPASTYSPDTLVGGLLVLKP